MTNFPLFHLSEEHYQAEIALSVLMCFGNETEKKMLKPKAKKLHQAYILGSKNLDLFDSIAGLINEHIAEYGALSQLLETFLQKSPKLLERVSIH